MSLPASVREPIVYITNLGRDHDYGPAAKWGAIRPITEGNFSIYKTHRILEEVIAGISDSQPTDYLALSGAAIICSIAVSVWLTMHGTCQILIFHPATNSYQRRSISWDEIRKGFELHDAKQG